MKKILSILIIIISLLFVSCDETDCGCAPPPNNYQNKVLVLKVDYTTNTFEGGKELSFAVTNTFTIQKQYQTPADFGFIKLYYQELNQPIFNGSIVWNGMGSISFPTDFQTANAFYLINTLVPPTMPVFENVHNPNNSTIDYTPVWNSIAYLEKVNQFIATNPTATVKIFLYTPDVGIGNPANWKWIVFVKN